MTRGFSQRLDALQGAWYVSGNRVCMATVCQDSRSSFGALAAAPAMVLMDSGVISTCSIFLTDKLTQVDGFAPLDAELCLVLALSFVVGDASVC